MRFILALSVAFLLAAPQASAAFTAHVAVVKIRVEDVPPGPIPDLPARPYQLSYLATAGNGGTFSFTVFLQSSATSVDTRWAYAGTPTIEAATFDAATRALLGTAAHAPFWIGDAELDAGSAVLGNDPATYLGVTPLGHLFESMLASYYFEPTTGVLLFAQTNDLEKSILLTGQGYVAVLPPANPSPTSTYKSSRPAFDPHPSDPNDPASIHIRPPRVGIGIDAGTSEPPQVSPTKPHCGGSFNQVFGGRNQCAAPFTVTGDFTVVYDTIYYPLYAMGNITFELQNPGGRTYHAYACSGHYPKTAQFEQTEPECGPTGADPTVPRSIGEHSIRGVGQVQFCLNPTSGFTCAWTVEATLE